MPLVVAWVTEAAEPSTLTLNAVVGAVVGLRVSLYVSVTWAPSLLVAALIKVGAVESDIAAGPGGRMF